MIRKVFSGIIFSLLAVSVASADEAKLRPLSEIFEDEISDATILYGLQRCAALYYSVYEHAGNSPSTPKQVLEESRSLSEAFIARSTIVLQEVHGANADDAQATAINAINMIVDVYIDVMNRHYARTGEAFNELVIDDMLYCREFAETLGNDN